MCSYVPDKIYQTGDLRVEICSFRSFYRSDDKQSMIRKEKIVLLIIIWNHSSGEGMFAGRLSRLEYEIWRMSSHLRYVLFVCLWIAVIRWVCTSVVFAETDWMNMRKFCFTKLLHYESNWKRDVSSFEKSESMLFTLMDKVKHILKLLQKFTLMDET